MGGANITRDLPSFTTIQMDPPETQKIESTVNSLNNTKNIVSPQATRLSNTDLGSYNKKRTFKVIVVGEANVGKTCLSHRFCFRTFPQNTDTTIGVDFRERCCIIDNELLRIQLWDTAGQERYRRQIVPHYYRNVKAIVFVYDVTSESSFEALGTWIAECTKFGLTSEEEVPRFLIANKCDIPSKTRVLREIAEVFADKNNMIFFETSAKVEAEAGNVESIFMTILHKLRQIESTPPEKKHGQVILSVNEKYEEKETWCC